MLNSHPDYRIICLDKLTYAGNLSTLSGIMDDPHFRFVKLDICDRAGVYQLFLEEKPDIVVNFAAESHVDRSIEDPSIFLRTNIIGASVLMNACREYGVKRYHQVSTDEVYGDLPLDRPDLFFTEETSIHTSSPYLCFFSSPARLIILPCELDLMASDGRSEICFSQQGMAGLHHDQPHRPKNQYTFKTEQTIATLVFKDVIRNW